ncbi:MAG: hypothetical protein A3E58_02110 [Candidatus Spechtbacteria bacterium RIFCSPHIGHO2_12_FULL_38_30]|nr:MAG: hypothetical protein A3E58_02110 [Candidatus Spechtbacteria bacterium RIFCSPHIGHO2_12_FULL_38_30]
MTDKKYSKVLVLGGTGFLGYYVLRALDDADLKIAIILHKKRDDLGIPFEGYELFEGDILNPETLKTAIESFKPNVIINTVGSLTEKPNRSFKRLYVEGMKNLVEVAEKGGVEKIVCVSDLAVKNALDTKYLSARREAEDVLKNSSLEWTIFRPSVIFGWRASFTNVFVDQIKKIWPILVPSDRFKLQPVAATTVSKCIAQASSGSLGNSKVYEIVGPEILTPHEIVERLKLSLNSQRSVWYVPFWFLKFMAFLKKLGFPTAITGFHIHVFRNRTLGTQDSIKEVFDIKEMKFDPKLDHPLY